MRRRWPSYADLSETLGVRRCRGIDPRFGSYCGRDHERGEWANGMLHWRDRRVRYRNLRAFLGLVWSQGAPASAPRWYHVYVRARGINALAARIGVRIPDRYVDADRAAAAALLARSGDDSEQARLVRLWCHDTRQHVNARILANDLRSSIDLARNRNSGPARLRALRLVDDYPTLFATDHVQSWLGKRRLAWLEERRNAQVADSSSPAASSASADAAATPAASSTRRARSSRTTPSPTPPAALP
jgi:hypothetical protein